MAVTQETFKKDYLGSLVVRIIAEVELGSKYLKLNGVAAHYERARFVTGNFKVPFTHQFNLAVIDSESLRIAKPGSRIEVHQTSIRKSHTGGRSVRSFDHNVGEFFFVIGANGITIFLIVILLPQF